MSFRMTLCDLAKYSVTKRRAVSLRQLSFLSKYREILLEKGHFFHAPLLRRRSQQRQHLNALMLSIYSFVCPFVCLSVRSSVRLQSVCLSPMRTKSDFLKN